MKRGRNAPCPAGSDSFHAAQLVLTCRTNAGNTSKLPEQQSSGHGRDSGNCRQHRFRGRGRVLLGAQRVHRSLARSPSALPASREQNDPACGVGGIGADEGRHSEIDNGDEQAANRICTERAVVDGCSLDEEERVIAARLEASYLGPERSIEYSGVQASDGLALDGCFRPNDVVADVKMFERNRRAQQLELIGNSARSFVQVDSDRGSSCVHRVSLPANHISALVSVRSTDTGASR